MVSWWAYGFALFVAGLGLAWLVGFGRLGLQPTAVAFVLAAALLPAARALQILPERRWWSVPAILVAVALDGLTFVVTLEETAGGADLIILGALVGSGALLIGLAVSLVRLARRSA